MTDLDVLYGAVLDTPADDTPRLAYADALDDLGRADLAAVVRTQVEVARAAPWDAVAVRARHANDDGTDLFALPDLPPGLSWAARPFRRGFPALVEARDGEAFVAGADRLFAVAPVESLELAAARASDVYALAVCPALARLKRLVIREGLGQAFAQVLLNSEHLAGLEELVIGPGLTSARTAGAVVRSRAFGSLRAFSYRDEQRGGAMVAALAQLADPPPLRALDLRGNRLTADGLLQLLRSPVAAGLEALDIGDNHIGPDGARAFVAAPLPHLRRLELARAGLGGRGVEPLLAGALVPRLRFLNLGGNFLAHSGGEWAARVGRLRGVLDLHDNRLGDDGVRDLVGAASGGLVHLDLSENCIGAAGAESLAIAPGLDALVALDLGGNAIPPAARQALQDRFGERVTV